MGGVFQIVHSSKEREAMKPVISLAQDAAVRAGKMSREEALSLAEKNKRVEGPEREPKASTQLLNKCDKAVGKVMQTANGLHYNNTRDGRSTYTAKLNALKAAVAELEALTNKIAE